MLNEWKVGVPQISIEFCVPLNLSAEAITQSIIILIKPEAESVVRHCNPQNRGMSYYWAELDDFVVLKRRYLLDIIQESLAATIQIGSLS